MGPIEKKAEEGNCEDMGQGLVPCDLTLHDLRAFFNLLEEANPHVLELIFTQPKFILEAHPAMKSLLNQPEAFLSLRVKDSFSGYAMSQIRRAKTHRSWLLDPPEKEPTRADFGLPPMPEIPKDQRQACLAWVARVLIANKGAIPHLDLLPENLLRDAVQQVTADQIPDLSQLFRIDHNFLDLLSREKRYEQALRNWKSYRQWEEHRNERRYELESQCGYDSKNIAHCIRLLTQAHEILKDGALRVHRHEIDREFLLEIKRGALNYDEVMDLAEDLMEKIRVASLSSSLPKSLSGEWLEDQYRQIAQVVYGIDVETVRV